MTTDRLAALFDAAEEAADAIEAYIDPENQYTDSRRNAVVRTVAALRAAIDALDAQPVELDGVTCDYETEDGPCNRNTGHAGPCAAQPAPDLRAAAQAVGNWWTATHGNGFEHDHHCPLGRGDDYRTPGDPAICTCGWAAASPALDVLADFSMAEDRRAALDSQDG